MEVEIEIGVRLTILLIWIAFLVFASRVVELEYKKKEENRK